jgi:hypothetical protein
MIAPRDSPRNDISVPSQKPKNKIFAAVIKTLGIIPNIATIILTRMLISIAD